MAVIKDKSGIELANDPNVDLRTLITRCARTGKPLHGAFLHNEWLRDTDMIGLNAPGSIWDGAYLKNARLDGADLRNASFRHCEIAGTDFRGANLTGIDWSYTELSNLWPAPKFSDGAHPVADKNESGLPGWFDALVCKAASGDQAARDELKKMMLDQKPATSAPSMAMSAPSMAVTPSLLGWPPLLKETPTPEQPALKLGRKAAKTDGDDS